MSIIQKCDPFSSSTPFILIEIYIAKEVGCFSRCTRTLLSSVLLVDLDGPFFALFSSSLCPVAPLFLVLEDDLSSVPSCSTKRRARCLCFMFTSPRCDCAHPSVCHCRVRDSSGFRYRATTHPASLQPIVRRGVSAHRTASTSTGGMYLPTPRRTLGRCKVSCNLLPCLWADER